MMQNNGLTKLIEECGELVQISAKRIAFPDVDEHPDGKGNIKTRLEEEIADVFAAVHMVVDLHKLDVSSISERYERKVRLFEEWHKKEN